MPGKPPAAPAVPPLIASEILAPRIVLSTFSGHATLALSQRGFMEFASIVRQMDKPVWIADCRELTGYDRDSITFGTNWFGEFKSRGGRHILIVAQGSLAMMAGRAIALGMGVRLDNEKTLEAAVARAKQLLFQS